MRVSDKLVEDLLAKSEKVTPDQIASLKEQEKNEHKPLQDIVLQANLISEKDLTSAFAEQIDVPFVEIIAKDIEKETLHLIPERIARQYGVVVYGIDKNGTKLLAMEDPDDIQAISFLQKQLGNDVRISIATKTNILQAIDQYRENISSEITEIISGEDEDSEDDRHIIDPEKHDCRDEVDETGEGLRSVADQENGLRPGLVPGCKHAEGKPDGSRDDDGRNDGVKRDHCPVPPTGESDDHEETPGQEGRPDATHGMARCGECKHHGRGRQPQDRITKRDEDGRGQDPAHPAGDGVDRVIGKDCPDHGVNLRPHRQLVFTVDLVKQWNAPGKKAQADEERDPDHEVPVALPPRRPTLVVFRLLDHPGLGNPVQRDGQQHDRHANLETAPQLERVHEREKLRAKTGHADERSKNDHRKREHDDLVDTNEDLGPGRRQVHVAQHLPAGRTIHLPRLDDFGGDFLQTKHSHQNHGRDGIDNRRDASRRRPDLEEDHRGQQVGEERQCLQHGQYRQKKRLEAGRLPREDSKHQAQRKGNWRRHDKHRKRLHRQFPLSDQRDPDEGRAGKQRKPPLSGGISQSSAPDRTDRKLRGDRRRRTDRRLRFLRWPERCAGAHFTRHARHRQRQ